MKLNQVIAITTGRKNQVTQEITAIHKANQKTALFDGLEKTYTPDDVDGEAFPPEKTRVRRTATGQIAAFNEKFAEFLDLVATQDVANCTATADIVVNEQTIAKNVPVTHLLFLEKKLNDIRTFVKELPVLDSAYEWKDCPATGNYRTDVVQRNRTKKTIRPVVLYEATEHHPAQVQTVNEDVKVGVWNETRLSGAMKASEKKSILSRVNEIAEAIKTAREEANGMEVQQSEIGSQIMDYIFTK